MIKKCSLIDKEHIFSYIGSDYPSCLYLYLNLIKYGFDSDLIEVFIQYDEADISSVMLKYYSCLHVYSKDNDFDTVELASFFYENAVSMLYCSAKTARLIVSAFPEAINKKSNLTTGWVAQIKAIDKKPLGLATQARDRDFEQIIKLIYNDEDIGRSYKYDELAKQIEERNRDGYARNIVIKKDDLVIAHACTNAEIKNIAIVAELLVRKEYRKKGYALEIWRDICNSLLNEGKEVYSFYYSDKSMNLHKKVGFFEVCEWAKVVIDRE